MVKFYNQGTRTFEFDSSQSFNEPGNYALRSAIEQGIVELVLKGERLNLWKFKEIPDELVQKNSPSEGAPKAPAAPKAQSGNGTPEKGNNTGTP
jgi:hypothetical protein